MRFCNTRICIKWNVYTLWYVYTHAHIYKQTAAAGMALGRRAEEQEARMRF